FFLDPCKPFPVEVIRYHPVPAKEDSSISQVSWIFYLSQRLENLFQMSLGSIKLSSFPEISAVQQN
uniref:Uncharacterized protein n=1 Tax=Triticum urartu TaxID=4572 RepID=A0A8R7V7V1_TRIUA